MLRNFSKKTLYAFVFVVVVIVVVVVLLLLEVSYKSSSRFNKKSDTFESINCDFL